MLQFKELMRICLVLSCIVLSWTGTVSAQDLKSKLPKDPNVLTGKFANGLTYYIRNNHKPANKVDLRLVVKAGSILENDNQQGLAHFMEHMNFNGTKNFEKNDLVSYLQSIGVQFGADLNAYTAFDQTVFILPIPTDKPGNLEKGFQIIEDWAHNALLTDKDIDDERGVVLEESRLGQGAQNRMLKKFFPKLAEGSLYAQRLPIGKDEILKTFKYEAIRSFYHDWYRPDLQAVVVVGDIDPQTALKMVKQHFEGLKNPANERPRKYVDVAPRKAKEAMVVTDKEATNSIVSIIYPYAKKHDEVSIGDYRENMIKELAINIVNQRFSDMGQSANPPFVQGGADFEGLIHGYEAFQLEALYGSDGPEKAINALTGEIMKVKKFGFTESELERAKSDMISRMEKMHNEMNTTNNGNYVEEYIRAFLDNEAFPGLENEYSYYKSFMPGIKVSELNEMVKKWTANGNTFSLIMAPEKSDSKLPTDKELLAMTENGFKQDIKQDEEKAVATSLLTTKPTPGKVIAQQKEDGLDATTYTLSNGIKVTIKTTDFKSDEILLTATKKGGFNNYGLEDKYNVNYLCGSRQMGMGGVIDAMGLGSFTPSDLEKVLSGKEANVDPTMDEFSDGFSGNSTVKDFETLMQLTYLYMTSPRKDAELYKANMDKMKSMLQFMTANPRIAFIDTMYATLYNGNPLRKVAIPHVSDLDKINLDRSLEIYKNEFCNADGFHFFLVGNIKPETAIPMIEMYLGSIPKAGKTPDFKDNGVRPISGNQTLKIKKGKDKQSIIMAIYTGETKFSEDLALKARALAEVLNIKVIEVLREKMGGIYTGGFNASVSKEPYERYSIQMQLPCGPENVDKLIAAANDVIKGIKDNGPEATDLDKVKSQWREKYLTDVKENKYWNDKLQNILFWGRDKDRVLNYQSYIEKLTPADVKETANKLFDGKNTFFAILYPEDNAAGDDKK